MKNVRSIFFLFGLIHLLIISSCQGELVSTCEVLKGSGTGEIEGNIELRQQSDTSNVTIKINLSGFNVSTGTKHGFHVHEVGSTGNQCADAKGHLNLDNTNHGAPTDPRNQRHTGDLGNVDVNQEGKIVDLEISDWLIKLSGPTSVVNKTIVIHAGEDDLGTGGFPDSNTTGHAGARLGCCIISDTTDNAAQRTSFPLSVMFFLFLAFAIPSLAEL